MAEPGKMYFCDLHNLPYPSERFCCRVCEAESVAKRVVESATKMTAALTDEQKTTAFQRMPLAHKLDCLHERLLRLEKPAIAVMQAVREDLRPMSHPPLIPTNHVVPWLPIHHNPYLLRTCVEEQESGQATLSCSPHRKKTYTATYA